MSKQPSHKAERPYPEIDPQLHLSSLEEKVLAFWDQDNTFAASIERNQKGESDFVFYDGPPFANGSPHYGHLLTGFVKDAIPRYQTMRGRRVERRFGWDCHGLPAEMAAEKELGVNGRAEVESLGIDKFNDHCRTLVMRTTDEWHRYVTRQARWVDFVDGYKTMDENFMESVIWAFARLHSKGLVYEKFRVLPYCWECETPLSNFETRQDDSYRPRIDPAVTVAFEILPSKDSEGLLAKELRALAWTTTPWTLPSNLALAVGREIDYVIILADQYRYVLAQARLEAYKDWLPPFEVLGYCKGSDLLQRNYKPLFPYFQDSANAFQILAGDFVTTEEGTGIVQIAPGFGEEDQQLCEKAGIEIVCPVDDRARFTSEVPEFAGMQVFEANPGIVQRLRENGALLHVEDYEHHYPHCWRTDTPLIYRAVSSWFVNVAAIKTDMLARNQEINWIPEHVKDGAFGKWLEGARDWSITRNRYWGTPIPVWKSDNPSFPRIDVYSSLEELERDFGVRPKDLHRPAIDELVRPNPDDPSGQSTMRRVSDILDCWFESGSMPYAQLHYPFEGREEFEANFPADFIVEFIGQTRGWFYTLHVLSVALFDKPPFKHCIAHGILLGEDGRKLSKRLKNYPDPWEVFETIGADAMRWFLLSSPVLRGQEMVLEKQAMFDTVKRVINPIWNAYYFLTLYGNADNVKGQREFSSSNLLDRYIVAKTAQLIGSVTMAMDSFDLSLATSSIETFLDALNNWYIRRSRERFWRKSGLSSHSDHDKAEAYNTLHSVILSLTLLSAPLLPMLSEEIYRNLTGERSVHLSDWPTSETMIDDPDLVADMDLVREVCSLAHSIRKAKGLRSRLPLRTLRISTQGVQRLERFIELIKDEINVKEIVLSEEMDDLAEVVLQVIPSRLGPRIGQDVQSVIRASKSGSWTIEGNSVKVAGIELNVGEFELLMTPRNQETTRLLLDRKGVIELDLHIDEELLLEGIARDLIRAIQTARKEAGLQITDRISLAIGFVEPTSEAIESSLRRYLQFIADQVLASSLTYGSGTPTGFSYETSLSLGKEYVSIALSKVST